MKGHAEEAGFNFEGLLISGLITVVGLMSVQIYLTLKFRVN